MNVGQLSPSGSKKKPDPSDSTKKPERKSDTDDPKPRIVLTFRSEKTGPKSSNMKIVSSEEKSDKVEEVSLRRSSRARPAKWESEDDEASVSPRKDKSHSETDETATPPKRSARGRSKEVDNTTSPAKKEPAPPTRLSRRIKPTAKVLENEELRIGFESQNNARLGLQTEKSLVEEGIRTRRSARSKPSVSEHVPEVKKSKLVEAEENQNQVLKLKHLCELGLKARSPEDEDGNDEAEEKVDIIEVDVDQELDVIELDEEEGSSEDDDQEIDDDTEVITKLLEEEEEDDENSNVCDSDNSSTVYDRDYNPKTSPARSDASMYWSDESRCTKQLDRRYRRRLSRRKRPVLCVHGPREDCDCAVSMRVKTRSAVQPVEEITQQPHDVEAAPGSIGCEAARPEEGEEGDGAVGDCCCELPSNLFVAPSDLTEEPMFCQAIETSDGVRIGCCHVAQRVNGDCLLARCGPRAPFVRLCALHHQQRSKHMCCTTCGMFCTQGIFYQCSKGHLFHPECGLPFNDSKRMPPGCPHCGLRTYGCEPVSRECVKVKVDMNCSNRRVYLQEQREQCPTAYLGFTPSKAPLDDSPVIPEDLLPSPPIDLKAYCQKDKENRDSKKDLANLYEAIVAGDTMDQLLPKIMSGVNLNTPLHNGDTCLHAACALGSLTAVYLLHYGGADLAATDSAGRTVLIACVTALFEKTKTKPPKKSKKSSNKEPEKMETDEQIEDGKIADTTRGKETRASDEDYLKVIRYLVAAGCDVNIPGPEGMTALHIAAQHGSTEACQALLGCGNTARDARDQGGWTPLVWAAENGHHTTVRLLLTHGADPLAVDNEGNAAIHWCALAGASQSMLVLLDASPGALHTTNRHADTPLHVAAREGHYACVVILLARGAKTDVENSAGELPVEVCTGKCQSAISLNMQMNIALTRSNLTRQRLLNSDISRGRELYPVPCVNDVDDAPLPEFNYVTSHVMPTNILIDHSIQTLQGCNCVDGECGTVECACVSLSVRHWTLGNSTRLRAEFPHHDPPMLFACNRTCRCDQKKCTNHAIARQISTGSLFVRAEVFRAGGGRGWGLRATAKIVRGTLVATYCGELLTVADADARPNDQYMFALTVKPDLIEQCAEKTQLCVDAHAWGSAARFINHSCKPNVACVRVFAHTRDLRLPTTALFATANVAKGEELTFDYGDKFWDVKSKWMRCECGTSECRYPEIMPDETKDKSTAPGAENS